MKVNKYFKLSSELLTQFTKDRKNTLQILSTYLYYYLGVTRSVPKPFSIQIEPSIVCNLKCKMCHVRSFGLEPKTISKKHFDSYFKKLLPLDSVNISGLGEPLLNKNIAYFVTCFSQNMVAPYFITNGQLLTETMAQKLIRAGISDIIFSLESADPVVYEKIRTGAKFVKLTEAISLMARLRKKRNFKIHLNTVFLPSFLADVSGIKALVDYSRKMNVDCITFSYLDDVVGSKTLSLLKNKKQEIDSNFREIQKYAQRCHVNIELPPTKISKRVCTHPWLFPYLAVTGDILPCCALLHLGLSRHENRNDLLKKYSFGNIYQQSLNDIWNSEKAIGFRKALKEKPNIYCKKCSKYYGLK